MRNLLKTYLSLATCFLLIVSNVTISYSAIQTRIRVCAIKGTVLTFKSPKLDNVCPLKQKMNETECRIFNEATYIETGSDGWASIEFAGTKRKVYLRPNTKIHVQTKEIYVNWGGMWYKTTREIPNLKQSDLNSEFWVKAPTAIAGIRGTEFVTEVKKDGSTKFQLIEGALEISDNNQQSKMNLAAGMEVSITANNPVLTPGILTIKKNDEWWTDWPTLVPKNESPLGNSPGLNITNANPMNPIADSHVYAYSYSNWNKASWGKYNILSAGWNPTGGEKRAYLKFDVSGIDKSSFEKATLKLYHYHSAGSNRAELGVFTVRNPWNEGTGDYKPQKLADANEICWENQPFSDQYPVAYFNPGIQTNDFVEVDITPLVKSWLEGMPNHGLAIKAGENYVSGSESMYGFYSREHADADKRPQLIINGNSSSSANISETLSSEFFEDFSNGKDNLKIDDPNARITDGKLFWASGPSGRATFNWNIPIENVVIEFDGYTENNGFGVHWLNKDNVGYSATFGGWYNTKSGSHFGAEGQNIELVDGKVFNLKQWHHYKVIRRGNQLSGYCDDELIFQRTITQKFEGPAELWFSSWAANQGLDNVKVYKIED